MLTGRHGFFSCYEAFIHIIDSMFNQHAKWLKVCEHIPWRPAHRVAQLSALSPRLAAGSQRLLAIRTPGSSTTSSTRRRRSIRVYLPPDANCLLSVTDHCLRSRNYVNVIVAGKQPAPQWLTMDEAIKHCTAGIGIWEWASNDQGRRARRGHGLLRRRADAGDAGRGRSASRARAGAEGAGRQRRRSDEACSRQRNIRTVCPDKDFDVLFTKDKPIIFAFHGYPWLIHRLTYRRTNHDNLHVRGYKEEGTTTTPFDMVVLNDMDRFHLVEDVIDRVPQLGDRAAYASRRCATS